jgi:hypothetical protein
MRIKEYIKEYTAGRGICFLDVLREIKEWFIELFKFNKQGIKEEFQDVLHFLQLWLYCRFGINGEPWKIARKSVAKFMDRKKVWQEIYGFVGLDKDISGYVGNYNKADKVIKHLSQFGISKEKAKEVYGEIISGRILENKSEPKSIDLRNQ